MKWSKQWVAALLLAPSMYLASCGGSNNNQENSDTLTTQSAPPVDATAPTTSTQPAADSSTTATVGEGGSNSATGSTNETTTSPANVAATGATSKTKSSSATSRKHKTSTSKKYKASSTTDEQSSRTSTEPVMSSDTKSVKPVTKTQDDADSGTLKKSLMDTTSSMVTTDTTGEDMKNMDSTGMNKKTVVDSSWNKSSVAGNTSTTDSAKSTLDSTAGIKNIDSAGTINSSKVGDTSMLERTTGNSTGMNFTPSSFISTQIQNNYGEIKMAKLAIDQSTNSDVKSIAKTLENDHNQALQELKDMAKNQTDISASLPTTESDSAKEHITMMQNNRGSDFDKIWVSHMHQMHERSVQNYEVAEAQITDPALKSWITKMLPKLREHRDKLAQLDRNINK